MSDREFSREFKKEAVKQIVVLDYSVRSVSERLGVPEERLIKWVDSFTKLSDEKKADEMEALRRMNRQLKQDLRLAQEELDVLRRAFRIRQRNDHPGP